MQLFKNVTIQFHILRQTFLTNITSLKMSQAKWLCWKVISIAPFQCGTFRSHTKWNVYQTHYNNTNHIIKRLWNQSVVSWLVDQWPQWNESESNHFVLNRNGLREYFHEIFSFKLDLQFAKWMKLNKITKNINWD